MKSKHSDLLQKHYGDICDEYLQTFCRNYGVCYDKDAWVADEKGTIACVGDLFFDFNDVIKYCVDNDLNDWNEITDWYEYAIYANEIGVSIPNFKSWHKGCPRLSNEQIDKINELRKDLNDLIEQAKESFKKEVGANGKAKETNLKK